MPNIEFISNTLAAIVLVVTALYFIALGITALAAPKKATEFLNAFASSAFAHVLEMSLRILVGVSLLLHHPLMNFATAFAVFGLVLIATSAVLLLLPWQLHHRFAQWATPWAINNLTFFALGSIALGIFLLISLQQN